MNTPMSNTELKRSRRWFLLLGPVALVVMVTFGKLVDMYDLPSETTLVVVFVGLMAAIFTAARLGRK